MIAAKYLKTRLVYGDLDDTALLEEESSKADIVLSKSSWYIIAGRESD